MNKPTFPIWYFCSHPNSNTTSSNCISYNNPANGCPYKIRSRVPHTKSSMFAQDFGHLSRGRRVHAFGHSDLRKFQQSVSVLLVYLSLGRYCISVTIWQPCNNIHYFCGSSWKRRRALFGKNCVVIQSHPLQCHHRARLCLCIFLCFWYWLRVFDVTHVPLCCKVDFRLVSLCASRITSFVALDFFPVAMLGLFRAFSHSLSTAAFASRIFIAFEARESICEPFCYGPSKWNLCVWVGSNRPDDQTVHLRAELHRVQSDSSQ